MQDCYVGDVGDFVKYGLLRALSDGKRLGVAWYLRTDPDTTKARRWQPHDLPPATGEVATSRSGGV